MNAGRIKPGEHRSRATEIRRGERRSPKTEFRRGGAAHNKLPLGSTRIRTYAHRNGEQRAWVKVGEPNVWKLRAVWVWEQETGRPLPRGLLIHHKDRNPLNDNFDNLEALTRAEHRRAHANDLATSLTRDVRRKAWRTRRERRTRT